MLAPIVLEQPCDSSWLSGSVAGLLAAFGAAAAGCAPGDMDDGSHSQLAAAVAMPAAMPVAVPAVVTAVNGVGTDSASVRATCCSRADWSLNRAWPPG